MHNHEMTQGSWEIWVAHCESYLHNSFPLLPLPSLSYAGRRKLWAALKEISRMVQSRVGVPRSADERTHLEEEMKGIEPFQTCNTKHKISHLRGPSAHPGRFINTLCKGDGQIWELTWREDGYVLITQNIHTWIKIILKKSAFTVHDNISTEY